MKIESTLSSLIAGAVLLAGTVLSGSALAQSNDSAACLQFAVPAAPHPSPLPPGGAPKLFMATTIAPSSTSSSLVIHPDNADHIRCTAGKTKIIRDIVYSTVALPDGKSLELRMDIISPTAAAPHPVVVYIPGGGFVFAAKEGAVDLRTYAAEHGVAVASITYRTVLNGATYVDSIVDAKAAVRFLRAHGADYGLKVDKIGAWGESAGGYLANMVGVTGGEARFEAGENLEQSSSVQAVVDKFGTSDMTKTGADFGPEGNVLEAAGSPFAHFVNGPTSTQSLLEDPSAATTANPITYVDAKDPPFLLFHGSRDPIISPSQTLILHTALRAAGVSSTRYVVDGASHGDLAFMGDLESGKPWATRQVMDILVKFLKDNLD